MPANYPNRDGRLGNGVGLDTPAGTMNVLRALAAAGYDTGELPENGQAFIERLAAGPTNDLTDRKPRPGGELYAVTAYTRLLSRLPEPVRDAIIARWRAPHDHPLVDRTTAMPGTNV